MKIRLIPRMPSVLATGSVSPNRQASSVRLTGMASSAAPTATCSTSRVRNSTISGFST